MAAVVGGELRDVRGPAGRVADRVDQDLDVADADLAVEPVAELDDLGVDRRARVADRLDVELPELAVPAGLGSVVAEHRPGHRELHGLRQGLHPVLDVGADDPGGRLGAERPGLGLLGPRGDPEQLLLDDVGDAADAPLEHGGLLEQRRLDGPVAVAHREARPGRLQPANTARSSGSRSRVPRGARKVGIDLSLAAPGRPGPRVAAWRRTPRW